MKEQQELTKSLSSGRTRTCTSFIKVHSILFFVFAITAIQLRTSFQLTIQDNDDISNASNHRILLTESTPSMNIKDSIPLPDTIHIPSSSENDPTLATLLLQVEGKLTTMKNSLEKEGETNQLNHDDKSIRDTSESIISLIKDVFLTTTTTEKTSHQDVILTTETENSSMLNDITTTSNVTNSFQKEIKKKRKRVTRAFFGIMTYDSKDEQKRRDLIRKTFLSYFVDHIMNRTLVSEEEYNEKKHWICSLNDLDLGRLKYPEKCRMAYAFVMGAGNPDGPTMLLNFNESYPLSLPPPKNETKSHRKDATDSVYLNIQENGKFGKSPTWFRYAIEVLERHGWMKDWDYIFKSDTDNLIYTPNFFRFMDRLPQKRAVRVFGGRPLDYEGCGGDSHDHCKQMVGPVFMAGGCYFLSLDLAKFISDETTFNHTAVKLPHEDMTTGNFVFSHPKNIKMVKEPRSKGVIRTHPVKTDRKFNSRWNKMLSEENDRLTSSKKANQQLKI
jgi:hypothetical protein